MSFKLFQRFTFIYIMKIVLDQESVNSSTRK